MTRFLGPFRPVLDPVFECFSFFFTPKNGRFLPFFAVFCHIFRNNPALSRNKEGFRGTERSGVTVSSHDSPDIIKIVIWGVFSCNFQIFYLNLQLHHIGQPVADVLYQGGQYHLSAQSQRGATHHDTAGDGNCSAGPYEQSFADSWSNELGVWMCDRFSRNLIGHATEYPNGTYRDLYLYCAQHTLGSHVGIYNYTNFGNLYTTGPKDFFVKK